MSFLQRRFERVIEYFVQGDLDRKMKRMSAVVWILAAIGAAGMFWSANLKIAASKPEVSATEKIPVWRALLNRK